MKKDYKNALEETFKKKEFIFKFGHGKCEPVEGKVS